MESINVIIADKSELVRLGITGILRKIELPFQIREFTNARKIRNSQYKEHKNLVIISNSYIKNCPPELAAVLLSKYKQTLRILIHDDEPAFKVFPDFDAVIEPEDNEKTIIQKLEKLLSTFSAMKAEQSFPGEISGREKEVLQLVAMGMTNKEIAERLYISSYTVITHRKNITAKLGIKTIAGLTVYAIIHKLIAPEDIH